MLMFLQVGDKGSLKVSEGLELPVTEKDDDFTIPNSLNCADNKDACQLINCEIDEIRRGSAYTNGFKISLFGKVRFTVISLNLFCLKSVALVYLAYLAT